MAAKLGYYQKEWKEELLHLSIKPIKEAWKLPTEKEKQIIIKILLYNSLILSILLYGCETWILSERLERRITAFEHKAYKRSMEITYREIKTNYYVYQIIVEGIYQVEHLLSKVKIRKISYFGHTMRYASLNKTLIQGCVFGKRRGESIQN